MYEVAFDPAAPGRVWAACSDQHDIPYEGWLYVRDGGGVARSDDAGKTWADFSGTLPGLGGANNPPLPVVSVQVEPGTRRVWVSVFGSGVFSSDDASVIAPGTQATWVDQSGNLPATNRNAYRLYLDPAGTLYCGVTGRQDPAVGGQFVAETGLWKLGPGAQWTRLTPVPTPLANLGTQPVTNMWWMVDYAVHPTNPDVIYVCTAHVRRGLTDGTHDVLGGVFRTTNATAVAPAWERVLSLEPAPGMPAPPDAVLPQAYRDFVHAFAPAFDPRDPTGQTVYVTTATHGTWITHNGATAGVPPTWREDKAIPFMSTHRLTFDRTQPKQSAVFITTFGAGAWAPVDVYLRDFVGDTGDPHTGPVAMSPDVIVKQAPVANPDAEYGEANVTNRDRIDLSDDVEAGQDNYVYLRLRNRGPRPAEAVTARAYWSPVSTLPTPNLWTKIGEQTIATVPAGDALTVTPAIVWPAANVPAPDHYCFIGLVGTRSDPLPDLVALANWDAFVAFIRGENNVTWRNFNVVDLVPAPVPGPGIVSMSFLARGALDRDVEMELEVLPNLPHEAEVTLEVPPTFARAIGDTAAVVVDDEAGTGLVALDPREPRRLGPVVFRARSRNPHRLLVRMPKRLDAREYDVAVRQLYGGMEVGRVTWQLRRAHERNHDGLWAEVWAWIKALWRLVTRKGNPRPVGV